MSAGSSAWQGEPFRVEASWHEAVARPHPTRDTTLSVVCIEPRRIRRLPLNILNWLSHLPERPTKWSFYLLHDPESGAASDVQAFAPLVPWLNDGRLRLPRLPRLDIQQAPVMTRQSGADIVARRQARLTQNYTRYWYIEFLASPVFWAAFAPSLQLLLLETDAVLCPAPAWPLERWLGPAAPLYVGGPGKPILGQKLEQLNSSHYMMNSTLLLNAGVSLWRRDLMETLAAPLMTPIKGRHDWQGKHNDIDRVAIDVIRGLHNDNKMPSGGLPSMLDAMHFSVAGWWGGPAFGTPFAVHNPQMLAWSSGNGKLRLSQMRSSCPPIELVLRESLQGQVSSDEDIVARKPMLQELVGLAMGSPSAASPSGSRPHLGTAGRTVD